jgi:effector-binding domain-containing protein
MNLKNYETMKKLLPILILSCMPVILVAQEKSHLGPISVEEQDAIVAMTAEGNGTMETIGQELGRLYGLIMAEIGKQNLQMSGPPFVHYLDYDETTGHSNYVAGIPVAKPGGDTDLVHPTFFAAMKVVQAMHTGPYEEFTTSYTEMEKYIEAHSLRVTGQAFEFYLTDAGSEPDPAKWRTLIAFPIQNEDGL